MPDLFIDGAWRSAHGGEQREIRCPADGELVTTVDEAGAEDTVAAIEAARRAFDRRDWPQHLGARAQRPAAQGRRPAGRQQGRRRACRVARHRQAAGRERVRRRRHRRASSATTPTPPPRTPAASSTPATPTSAAGSCTSRSASAPSSRRGTTPCSRPRGRSRRRWRPATRSCSSRASSSPSTAILLMRYLDRGRPPAGVGNLVLGAGPTAGAPLSTHPDVDLVSFTGGLETGKALMASGGRRPSRRSRSSSAARTPTSCSTTPTSTSRSTSPSRRCSCTRARCARRGPGCSSRSRSRPTSSTSWSRRAEQIRLGGPVRRQGRDRRAHLGGPPRQGRGVRRPRHRGGRDPAVRRRAARRPGAGRAATSTCRPILDDCTSHDERRAGRVVRPGPHRRDVHRRRRRRGRSPTTASTAWPARSGPRTPAAPSGSPRGCGWARSGSTTTTRTSRRPSGAATSSPASAASSAPPASTSTARPSTSGTTCSPTVQQLVRWRVMAPRASRRSGTTSSSAAGRRAARSPTGSAPTRATRCWCSRPGTPTSGSTRSSTCRPRCPSRSATGSTTGSTRPSPSRT